MLDWSFRETRPASSFGAASWFDPSRVPLASDFNDELMAQRHKQKQSSALPIAIAQLPWLAAEIGSVRSTKEEADDLRSISIPTGRHRALVCVCIQTIDIKFKETDSDADGFADPARL